MAEGLTHDLEAEIASLLSAAEEVAEATLTVEDIDYLTSAPDADEYRRRQGEMLRKAGYAVFVETAPARPRRVPCTARLRRPIQRTRTRSRERRSHRSARRTASRSAGGGSDGSEDGPGSAGHLLTGATP